MSAPDFEALRAKRSQEHEAFAQKVADDLGVPRETLFTIDPSACYCSCTTGGPCEHRWDGKPHEGEGLWTTTCSRCGMHAISHSLRTAP
jgi:hypothetical protein